MGLDGNNPPKPNKHPEEDKCAGFGKKRFAGQFLLDKKKLADNTDLANEKLDLYDMEEYDGMDKAVLWAVRAVLHRAGIQKPGAFKPIQVLAGYRCWHDNYHHTDDARRRHRRSTFHLGKTIEFLVRDHCTELEWKDTADSCPQCNAIRQAAIDKCGFQLRWQQPGRLSVAEGLKDARPPSTPFSVQIDTVRRFERQNQAIQEKDEFVTTDDDALKPLYDGKINTVQFPIDLGAGTDPRWAPSADFFNNAERGPGGWFPIGLSRLWHGGIHLHAPPDTPVCAIADGEIVGCRVGESPDARPHGSRNFVLVRHKLAGTGPWKDQVFYSLYMHLDAGNPTADADIPWHRQLFLQSEKHIQALVPCPLFKRLDLPDTKKRFFAWEGLMPGERVKADGAETDAKTEEGAPPKSKIVKLADLTDGFAFTQRDGKAISKLVEADSGLKTRFDGSDVIALKAPIRVSAGDPLGKVAPAAQSDPIKAHGSFLHLETFAAEALPVGAGFVAVAAKDAAKIADRKAIVAALVKAGLLPQPPDGVLLEADLKELYARGPYYARLRSAVVEMPSAWSVDWSRAFQQSKPLGFLKDDARDALARAFKDYNWWDQVRAVDRALPASPTVFHYHPIALILAVAFQS
jgi:murein DD-endopeptidase MepM/ murein hydrolase activator NlpD